MDALAIYAIAASGIFAGLFPTWTRRQHGRGGGLDFAAHGPPVGARKVLPVDAIYRITLQNRHSFPK